MTESQQFSQSGTLPVLHINTQDLAPIVDKINYLQAGLWVEIPDGCDTPEFALGTEAEPVSLEIRGRGNSSWNAAKKPYKVKFSKKTEWLGMPKHKHFALLAARGTFMAAIGMELSRICGLGWSSRYYPVELMLNGEFKGLYFVFESVKIDKNRLDIFEQEDQNVNEETIPYGWLIEIDNYPDECQIKVTETNGTLMMVTYHTPENLSEQQLNWLTEEFTAIAQAPYGENPDKWAEYIDAESLARYFIARELYTDGDGFCGSWYMYRDMEENAKWKMGPMWDMTFSSWGDPDWTMENLPDFAIWKLMPAIFPTNTFQTALWKVWDEIYPRLKEIEPAMLELSEKCDKADEIDAQIWDNPRTISPGIARYNYSQLMKKADFLEMQKGTTDINDVVFDENYNEPVSVEFYSLSGERILQEPQSGFYFRRIAYKNGSTKTIKVVAVQ